MAPGQHRAGRCQLGERVVEIRSTPIQPDGMAFSFDDVTERIAYEERLRDVAETLERRVAERTTALEAEVAERRAMEAELLAAKTAAELASRSKTSFLAAASHDLLQPLNAARLFVSALAERRLAVPSRALVRQAGVALDSVEELLEALFEISRLDAGAVQPEIAAIELDRMLGALRIEFMAQAKQAGLALDIPDTGLWVKSDFRMLRRILQNFLSNALRYTGQGSVAVRVESDGAIVRIAVKDTGRGIDPAHFDVIFEEFRRLSAQRGPSGKGLGLAIVKRASQMLGHRLEVASQPGEGSEFAVLVPLSARLAEEAPLPRPRERGLAAATGTVLIIDNEPAILEGMQALLGKWGYGVATAGTLEEARAQVLGEAPPALIIADYHLDDDQLGDEMVAALRAECGVEIPALVISADRTAEVKARLTAAGLPLLNKPVKPAQLRALLRMMMA
ncbi:MAG TPA: hybrid sensor histidine kinase/response regulator, partial [Novosphingobium sp.]|nr:hybrid sensor histidine kinase/response regulator [Novosphingobium sp.]